MQRDQLQEKADRQREEDERQLLALQEQQEKYIENQQILINEQIQEQQKQLLHLQQQQQNVIGGFPIITVQPVQSVQPIQSVQPVQPVQPVQTMPTIGNIGSDNTKPSTTITDDAVIVENTSLPEDQPKDIDTEQRDTVTDA